MGLTHTLLDTQLSNSTDYNRLTRAAREYRATISWNHDASGLEILVHAPRGFLWKSCQDSTIRHFTEKLTHDKRYVSEAVDSVIEVMNPGTQLAVIPDPDNDDEDCTGDDTCECSRCESYDPEIEELRFC